MRRVPIATMQEAEKPLYRGVSLLTHHAGCETFVP